MSGTSLDGVLARFEGQSCTVLAHVALDLPGALRSELLALNTPGGVDELQRAALAANALSRLYAQAVRALPSEKGLIQTR